MSTRPDLNTYEWRKIRARIRAERQPCHLCGQPIDYEAPRGDKWAFSVDHVIARDSSMLMAAHNSCNARKGDRPLRSRGSRKW